MSAPNIITTGHNSDGLSTFIDNPKYKAFSPHVGILYGTVGDGPINLNDDADISAFEATITLASSRKRAAWFWSQNGRLERTVSPKYIAL